MGTSFNNENDWNVYFTKLIFEINEKLFIDALKNYFENFGKPTEKVHGRVQLYSTLSQCYMFFLEQ